MIRKIWIINLTIAVITVLLFSTAYRFWHRSGLAATEKTVKAVAVTVEFPRIEKKNILGEKSYDIIENNNLFSPERKASVKSVKLEAGGDEKVTEDTTPAFIKQKYALSATIIEDKHARALIKAPVQDKTENPIRWVSVNDRLDEYVVSEILADKIYIKNSSERYAIPLYKPKEANGSPVPTAVQAPEREAPKVISTQSAEKKKTEKEKSGEDVIDGNYKIIETPFGKSRIRIK